MSMLLRDIRPGDLIVERNLSYVKAWLVTWTDGDGRISGLYMCTMGIVLVDDIFPSVAGWRGGTRLLKTFTVVR